MRWRETRQVVSEWVAMALVCMASAAGCSGGAAQGGAGPTGGAVPSPPRPSLLIVTLDTWRWDYIGASGSGRVATPALDGLARQGLYEPEAETPYPLTTPAHTTLFTGLHPLHHRVFDCVSYSLAPGVPTLAEAFRAQGYGTAAFVSSQTLARAYGLDRGFDRYDDGEMGRVEGAYWQTATRDGARVTSAVLAHVKAQPIDLPLFLWAHYFDLHVPYRPRPAYDARYPGNPYAAQAAFLDDQVALLLEGLQRDSGREWRLLIVGDHGEGLGDRGERGHGLGLYRSTLHVPLLFYPKPEKPLIHAKPWRLEDLDATVQEWFGFPALPGGDGESLFSTGTPDRSLPVMTLQPSIVYGANPCLGIRRGNLQYLRHGAEELYDLGTDPGETRDLARDPKSRVELESLRRACAAVFAPATLQAIVAPTLRTAPAELQQLQGIGYIGGFVPAFADLQRVPIGQLFEDETRFEAARSAYAKSRDPGPFLAAYREVLARYPRAALFYQHYGILNLEVGNHEEAFRAFDRAVRLNPKDIGSLINLGTLHLERGQVGQAKVLFETALGLDPANLIAHKNLGVIYGEFLNQPAQAVFHYRKYLEAGGGNDSAEVRRYIESHGAAAPPSGR